mgnify:CR=1 FL=1
MHLFECRRKGTVMNVDVERRIGRPGFQRILKAASNGLEPDQRRRNFPNGRDGGGGPAAADTANLLLRGDAEQNASNHGAFGYQGLKKGRDA